MGHVKDFPLDLINGPWKCTLQLQGGQAVLAEYFLLDFLYKFSGLYGQSFSINYISAYIDPYTLNVSTEPIMSSTD